MLKHYQREQIIWQSSLTSNETILLLALNSFVDANGECWPGQELLARMCKFSDRTVRNTCKSLEKKGIIRRQKRFSGKGVRATDLYKISFDSIKNYLPEKASGRRKGNAMASKQPEKTTTGKSCQWQNQPEEETTTGKNRPNQPENIDQTNRKILPNQPEAFSREQSPLELSIDLSSGIEDPEIESHEPEEAFLQTHTHQPSSQASATQPKQSVNPVQQKPELVATGQLAKAESVPASSKISNKPRQLTEAIANDLGLYYNSVKPELWAPYRPALTLSKDRERLFSYLWDYAGWNLEEAKQVISLGMAFAKCDEFYSCRRPGGNGSTLNRPGINFFLEKSRFEQWSEQCPGDPAQIHKSGIGELQLQQAKGKFEKQKTKEESSGYQKLKKLGIL